MGKYSTPRQIWRAIYPFLIFFGVAYLVIIFGGIVVGATVALRDGLDLDAVLDGTTDIILEYGLWFDLVSKIINITIFALMWRKMREYLPKYDNVKAKSSTVVLTIFLFASFNYVLVSVFEITNLIHYFPSYDEIAEAISGSGFLSQMLVIGIGAPVVEELLCRGVVLNRMLSWMPKWVAALASSAIFGLIHLNLLQSLYAFVVGIALAALYLRYRNLWVPIVGHIAFNSANLILIEIFEVTGAAFNAWLLLVPSALFSVVCVTLLIACTKSAVPAQYVYNHAHGYGWTPYGTRWGQGG